MSLASEKRFSYIGANDTKIKEILVLLYKLLKPKTISLDTNEYNYNYEYFPPLAMTGVNNVFGVDLPIPCQEFPRPKWVLLILLKITIILINDALNKIDNYWRNTPSLKVKNQYILQIYEKLQILEEIDSSIQDTENTRDIEDIAIHLAANIQELKELLHCTDPSIPVFRLESISDIENKLREVDEEFCTNYKNENGQNVSSLWSPDLEESTEVLGYILRDIIIFNVVFLNLFKGDLPEPIELSEAESVSNPSLKDYNKLFQAISLPEISSRFQDDLVFAYMQVGGPNPLMLRQVLAGEQTLAISNEEYAQIMGTSDSLEAAIAEGRLYLADYSKLSNMEGGNFHQQQKYIYAPVALFAVSPFENNYRPLLPVAIQCQPADVINNPIFTPLSGDNWQVAKTIVQMADSNYHELVSHLGRTHLFIEPFAIATRRQLPQEHPLRILLEPHLEGTILINHGAHKFLLTDQGVVDQLLASKIASDRQLAVQAAQDYLHNFEQASFPNILSSRNVDNYQISTYPYRDDGRLIWVAIYRWISAYLNSRYSSDYQLIKDQHLQNWTRELVSENGGRLRNFGDDGAGRIRTLDYLINAVTTIIFTASAQHAAVNFPQSELMSYTPAFPLAVYNKAPNSCNHSEDFMNLLPSLDQAQDQLKITYLLGSVYYTRLGQYSRFLFESNSQISSALNDFKTQLRDIEEEINWRNQTDVSRILPYNFLRPAQIPQSINI